MRYATQNASPKTEKSDFMLHHNIVAEARTNFPNDHGHGLCLPWIAAVPRTCLPAASPTMRHVLAGSSLHGVRPDSAQDFSTVKSWIFGPGPARGPPSWAGGFSPTPERWVPDGPGPQTTIDFLRFPDRPGASNYCKGWGKPPCLVNFLVTLI